MFYMRKEGRRSDVIRETRRLKYGSIDQTGSWSEQTKGERNEVAVKGSGG